MYGNDHEETLEAIEWLEDIQNKMWKIKINK